MSSPAFMALTEEIKKECSGRFDLVGICSAEHIDGFPEKRQPAAYLEGSRSIVVVAKHHGWPEPRNSVGSLEGRICGLDGSGFYWGITKEMMDPITGLPMNKGFKARSTGYLTSDEPPLKPLAVRAGLSWYGKNSITLTERFGSRLALGAILTDADLLKDRPNTGEICGQCEACIRACPTRALATPFKLDRSRCIAYISEHDGIVPLEFRGAFRDWVVGCDSCSEVCPKNRVLRGGWFDSSIYRVSLGWLIDAPESELCDRFGNMVRAGGYSTESLRRNAVIALGNSLSSEAIPFLGRALKHGSKMVRAHAAWALGEIGEEESRFLLEDALTNEKDAEVRLELRAALERPPRSDPQA